MGEVAKLLRECRCIGIDSCCFIFQMESNFYPVQATLAQELLELVESGKLRGVTSPITIAEIMTRPRKLGLEEVAYQYKMLLLNLPNLAVPDITPDIADRAATLRAIYNLRSPDALQLATSIMAGADAFVTFDKDFARAGPSLKTVVLDV